MPKNPPESLPKGTQVPDHIMLIPDGNRRWARANSLTPMQGHKQGSEKIVEFSRQARDWGVHTLTVWGLSTENWFKRPKREVDFLMGLFVNSIEKYITEADRDGVRIIHLGRRDRLPKKLLDKLIEAEEKTKNNKKYIFNIALDYNGQDEIKRAIQRIVRDKVDPKDIDEKLIDSYMDTASQPYPYPDLIIRTSGEQRTSGALAWQSGYAETYWEESHLPAFTIEKLKEAIVDYSRRRRRFGGNDEIKHLSFKPELVAALELEWWRLGKIPEGQSLSGFAIEYLAEQYGLSKKLAKEAAYHMAKALLAGEESDWKKAKSALYQFYVLVKDHLKLAFEPEFVASLKVKLWREIEGKDDIQATAGAEEAARALYAEEYRISALQAAKLAHLRVMAQVERNLALRGHGDHHWDKAEIYLQKFYQALKDRVA